MSSNQRKYTSTAVCEMVGCPPNRMRGWIRRGVVPFGREGRSVMFSDDDLAEIRRSIKAGNLKAGDWAPPKIAPEDHEMVVLVDDPTGEFDVGVYFTCGAFLDTLDDGFWPEGSVWRGEGGPCVDRIYRVSGRDVDVLVSYSRFERIANAPIC